MAGRLMEAGRTTGGRDNPPPARHRIRGVVSPLSAHEVALHLGCHLNTVKRLSPAELPFFRVGTRGDRRYHLEDVYAYIERRSVHS